MKERIAVVGLGYVGLPVALAFARKFPGVLGFDIDKARVDALEAGNDWTGECEQAALEASTLRFTADPADLKQLNFYIVAVPTPIDGDRQPDLGAIKSASRTVGAQQGRCGGLRIDSLSGRDGGNMQPDPVG